MPPSSWSASADRDDRQQRTARSRPGSVSSAVGHAGDAGAADDGLRQQRLAADRPGGAAAPRSRWASADHQQRQEGQDAAMVDAHERKTRDSNGLVAHLRDVGCVGDAADIVEARDRRSLGQRRDRGLERGDHLQPGGLAERHQPHGDRDLRLHRRGEVAEQRIRAARCPAPRRSRRPRPGRGRAAGSRANTSDGQARAAMREGLAGQRRFERAARSARSARGRDRRARCSIAASSAPRDTRAPGGSRRSCRPPCASAPPIQSLQVRRRRDAAIGDRRLEPLRPGEARRPERPATGRSAAAAAPIAQCACS